MCACYFVPKKLISPSYLQVALSCQTSTRELCKKVVFARTQQQKDHKQKRIKYVEEGPLKKRSTI